MISFERSLQDNFTLRMVCVPVGETSEECVRKAEEMLGRVASVLKFSNFYQALLREQTMSAFPEKDWNAAGIRVAVERRAQKTEWPELMMYLKPWLLFGVVDLKEGELREQEVQSLRRKALDEKSRLVRVLAVNGREGEQGSSEVIYLPAMEAEKAAIVLQDQLQVFACDVITHFAREVLRLKNDQSSIVLFNMKEDKISDSSRLKKRKLGRSYKLMGDMALLALSVKDATNYYRQAQEILAKNGDLLWLSSLQESLASVKVLERTMNPRAEVELQIEEHFREALTHLKKTRFTTLEIETFFKLMQFRKDIGDKLGLNKTVNLFLKSFDPDSPPDKCKFYVFVAKLYGQLAMTRKQAFYLKLASNFIRNINRPLSDQLMAQVQHMYGLKKPRVFWPSLQLSLSQEILNFTQDHSERLTIQIQMVQLFKDQFTDHKIFQIFQNLNQDSLYSQHVLKANLSLLPRINQIIIDPYNGSFKKQAPKSNDVFIVNPFNKKKKKDIVYPQHSLITVRVKVSNEFHFDFFIDTIKLEYEGVECLNYPSSVLIPALSSNYEFKIQIKPLEEGVLTILGAKVTFLNFEYSHKLEEQSITVIERLPSVAVEVFRQTQIIQDFPFAVFDPTEIFSYQLILKNQGSLKVEHTQIDLCIEFENPPIYECQLSLKHALDEQATSIYVLKEEGETEDNVLKIPHIRQPLNQMKKISLYLQFKFNAQCAYAQEVKVVRLIKLEESIRLKQCRFISKYRVEENAEVASVCDLQDSCYLDLEIEKCVRMMNIQLKSALLLEGTYQKMMTENLNHISKVLRLRKKPLDDEKNELVMLWHNMLDNTFGQIKPLERIDMNIMNRQCCKDLVKVDISTKPLNNLRTVRYKLQINRKIADTDHVQVDLTIIKETVYTHQSSQQSLLSQVEEENHKQIEILNGQCGYDLHLQEDWTTKEDEIIVIDDTPICLKIQVLADGIAFIKKGQIK